MKRSSALALHVFVALLCVTGLFLGSVANTVGDAGEKGVLSSSLKKVTTKVGKSRRTDFVDDNNVITYAIDKRYASVIKTTDGNTVREEYLDESGRPAKQKHGNCGLLKVYNDHKQNTRIVYLGADGNPIAIDSGYAIIERTFDDFGRIQMERYFDADGNPARSKSKGYGFVNGYDADGRNASILYMNGSGELSEIDEGYAILTKTFCKAADASNGKVAYEYYQDAQGEPVRLSMGYSAIHKEYDQQGNNTVLTYLGPDGLPAMTKLGYASVQKTYKDAKLQTEKYYDEQGQPVALRNGQYGLRHVNGGTVYLDKNGREYFDLKKLLYAHPFYVSAAAFLIVVIAMVLPRLANIPLLVLYACFIAYMTLISRPSTGSRANLELFWSYRQLFTNASLRQEIVFNILLFVPLGAILYRLLRRPYVVAIALAVTIGVETIQYVAGVGLCEFDDIVSNGMGAAIGALFAYICRNCVDNFRGLLRLPWKRRSKQK